MRVRLKHVNHLLVEYHYRILLVLRRTTCTVFEVAGFVLSCAMVLVWPASIPSQRRMMMVDEERVGRCVD